MQQKHLLDLESYTAEDITEILDTAEQFLAVILWDGDSQRHPDRVQRISFVRGLIAIRSVLPFDVEFC